MASDAGAAVQHNGSSELAPEQSPAPTTRKRAASPAPKVASSGIAKADAAPAGGNTGWANRWAFAYIRFMAAFSGFHFFMSIGQLIHMHQSEDEEHSFSLKCIQLYSLLAHPAYIVPAVMVVRRGHSQRCSLDLLVVTFIAAATLAVEYAWSMQESCGMGIKVEGFRTFLYVMVVACVFRLIWRREVGKPLS